MTEKTQRKTARPVDLLKKSITDFLKDMAIPPVCTICGKISAGHLCRECISLISTLDNGISCGHCGNPLSYHENGMCSMCRNGEYNFTAHRSYALYSGNMKKIIQKYKYRKIYGLKEILSGFLSQVYDMHFAEMGIDLVDTVPGEHTDLLAGSFSKRHRIPFAANIIKIRKPERQGSLGLAGRKINILDCFKLRDCLAYIGKNILFIDDVWTTGSTLNEICRLARSGGADQIYLLTLARRA